MSQETHKINVRVLLGDDYGLQFDYELTDDELDSLAAARKGLESGSLSGELAATFSILIPFMDTISKLKKIKDMDREHSEVTA